ncbi:MAG: peroxidase family protein, partial [Myxococcota bacterium]
ARGLAGVGERFDPKVVDSLREALFAAHQGDMSLPIRLDLIATNLLRGRELQIASYNELRAAHGLERYTRFDQISDDSQVIDGLRSLYHRDGITEAEAVGQIEAWVGAVSEKHAPSSDVGELIGASFRERFRALQNGDRFNFNEAGRFNSLRQASEEAGRRRNAGAASFKLFADDLEEIRSTTLFGLLERNGVDGLPSDQKNLFRQSSAQEVS